MKSLVIIIAIGRKHVDMDFCFKNAVDKSMLSCDFAAPSPFGLPLQWLRVTQPCLRMVVKLADKPQSLIVSLRLIFKKFSQVGQCFFLDDDRVFAHRLRMYLSSSSTLSKLFPVEKYSRIISILHDKCVQYEGAIKEKEATKIAHHAEERNS